MLGRKTSKKQITEINKQEKTKTAKHKKQNNNNNNSKHRQIDK